MWFIERAQLKARNFFFFFFPKPISTEKKHYVSLPYIAELDSIVPLCQKLDVNIGFKQMSTIKSMLVRNKTHVETLAGVYKIPCKDCDSVYRGETGRCLEKRIKEHKYAVRTANYNNAIAKHVWDENHCMDWKKRKTIVQNQ